MSSHAKEKKMLIPVLDAILSSGTSKKCVQLLEHLENKLLVMFFRWLNAFIRRKKRFKLPPEEEENVKKVLSPYQKELIQLSSMKVDISQRRKSLAGLLRRDRAFHRIFAAIAKTLFDCATKKPEIEKNGGV